MNVRPQDIGYHLHRNVKKHLLKYSQKVAPGSPSDDFLSSSIALYHCDILQEDRC
jgi:hypothetical protein